MFEVIFMVFWIAGGGSNVQSPASIRTIQSGSGRISESLIPGGRALPPVVSSGCISSGG